MSLNSTALESPYARLQQLAARVGRLNRDAGEIGAGMLAQLVDEARAALAAPAILTLPADTEIRYTRSSHREGPNGFRAIECEGLDCELSLQTPTCADPGSSWHRPGRWYGQEIRRDASGRRWMRHLDRHFVMDDFGSLVAIPGEPQ